MLRTFVQRITTDEARCTPNDRSQRPLRWRFFGRMAD
jgi:hypothetical protein